jgi:hypothetical protein
MFHSRSLASLSDFSLDVNNGNFDTYSGVQTVTDTMLSGHEASKADSKQDLVPILSISHSSRKII